MELYLLIAVLGIGAGFLSGLVGIGGGIVMAPLLLYAPPLVGLPALPMKTVAGLTIIQGLVACLAGALAHRRLRFVSDRLSFIMGSTIFMAAAVGGAASDLVADEVLLGIFGALAVAAAVLILRPVSVEGERPDAEEFSFSTARAILAAGGVGLLGGLVGQGGSFILIPLMIAFVHVPTRIAIGSNLAIVFLSSLAGSIGKAATGQIAWALTVPLVLTVVPAARFGSCVSSRVPVATLRKILAVLIGIAAVKIWTSVIFS